MAETVGERLAGALFTDTVQTNRDYRLEAVENNILRLTNESNQQGMNVKSQGAKGDGLTIDSDAIEYTINLVTTDPVKIVYIPDGTYLIDRTIVVPSGIHLKLSPKAILKAKADVNIIQLKPDSKVTGGVIDTTALSSFSKACIYLNGNDIFKIETDHVYVDGTLLNGLDRGDRAYTGKGIHLYSGKGANFNPSYVSFVRFMQMGIFNFEYGILLETDTTITTDANMAWVNGNSFDQINMFNCLKAITLLGDSNTPRDCTGNQFSNMQVQVEPYTNWVINCEGGWNKFEGMWWDLHKSKNKTFIFAAGSRFNRIESMHGYEGTGFYTDNGYLNVIASQTNHVPDTKTLAYPLSTPFTPNMLGNQDDYLAWGDLRGYTVTQTSAHPLPMGEISTDMGDFTGLFSIDTELGAVWSNLVADYDNQLILEVDLSSDPVPYMAFMGFVSAYKSTSPQNVVFESYDGIQWTEYDWFTRNTDNQFFCTAPWASVNSGVKIRIRMWNNDTTPRTVQISRLFAISTKTGGKTYMPQNGGTMYGDLTFPSNDVGFRMTKNNGTPTKYFVTNDGALVSRDNKFPGYTPDSKNMCYPMNRPYKPNMLGAQDDILAYCTKRGVTVTQTSTHPRDYGANDALFTFDSEDAIRWDATNATEVNPITLEVDLTTDREIIGGYLYSFYFGMNSTWTNFAQNIIIEVLEGNPAPDHWVTVLDMRNNTTENFVCSTSWDAINVAKKIRVKFWGANNADKKIAYTRLFALSTKTPGQAWFPKSGGIINGDSTIEGLTTAKGGFILETRTTDPTFPEIGRMWLRSDL